MEEKEQGKSNEINIALAIPTYDGTASVSGMSRAFVSPSKLHPVSTMIEGSSCLPQTFNKLWATALSASSPKFTHFAMLHSDVVPSECFLDTLMGVMEETKSVVVSAVAAIKDAKGVSSTAVGSKIDEYDYRRITMTELKRLPDVFGIDHVVSSGIWPEEYTKDKCLLVNTGCMLVDLRWPHWLDMEDDGVTMKFCFEMDYRLQRWPDGRWCPEFSPEDWRMSRYVARNGGKVVATTRVVTNHIGNQHYPSNVAWGSATDIEIDKFNSDRARAMSHGAVT